MVTVGVRDLKAQLSSYLRRVERGERLIVTDRGRPIVSMSPVTSTASLARLDVLVQRGAARWSGGKPAGSAHPPRLLRGDTVAEAVIEGRR